MRGLMLMDVNPVRISIHATNTITRGYQMKIQLPEISLTLVQYLCMVSCLVNEYREYMIR